MDPEPGYDYTEGASSMDINQALDNSRRTRRDSQYSTYYDGEGDGAMFSGPGHVVNPSSVTRMSHIELGRRSSDGWLSRRKSFDSKHSRRTRRDSRDSQVSRQSVAGEDGRHIEDETGQLLDDDAISSASKKKRHRGSPSPPHRSSVFGDWSNIFSRTHAPDGRRPSVSQRSTTSRTSRRSRRSDAGSEHALDTEDEDEEERWGYSSGEEDSESEIEDDTSSMNIERENGSITASMQYDSEPPSPHEGNQTLPLLDLDPVFGGESRIEMDTGFTLLEPPPPGAPSRQTIYISDEDSTVRFVGYDTVVWRVWLWRIFSLLTLGLLPLLGHWFPRLWLRWVACERAFSESHGGFLVVEVSFALIRSTWIHLNIIFSQPINLSS